MGIFHDRVVASRDKGMAEDWNADHKIQGNVDFRYYAAENMLIESVVAWPPGPPEGQIIYRSDLDATYIFDGTDWSLLSRRVNYWSCPGTSFTTFEPAVDDIWHDGDEGVFRVNSGNIWAMAPVYLPHGAIVTHVKVFGLAAGKSWVMRRIDPNNPGFAQTMASGLIGAEDNTINFATIDNQNYNYQIETSIGLTADMFIYGVRITYTL